MSFPNEAAHLAGVLAELAATGPPGALSPADGHAVVTARREVLLLLGRVLHDTTAHGALAPKASRYQSRDRFTMAVSEHPVALFARVLTDYPAPRGAFAYESGPEPDSELGRCWRSAGDRAQIAAHVWSTSAPHPTGDQRWSAVADIAAMAACMSVLDHNMLRSAATEPTLAAALTPGLVSGLRLAAHEVGALAAAGPLPAWGEPGPGGPVQVMIVRTPGDVVQAHRRMTRQIAAARAVDPQSIALVLAGEATVLALAANGLARTDPAGAARAADLAELMRAGLSDAGGVAALFRGDLRAVHQSRELATGLSRLAAAGWDSPGTPGFGPALGAVVEQAPVVARALADRAVASVRDGTWLVPNPRSDDPTELLWQRVSKAAPAPKLCATLSAMAADAATIAPPTTAGVDRPGPAPPRAVLAGVDSLLARERPRQPIQRPHSDYRMRPDPPPRSMRR